MLRARSPTGPTDWATVRGMTVSDDPLAKVPVRYRWRYGYRWGSLLFSAFLVVLVAGYVIGRGVADGDVAFGLVLTAVILAGLAVQAAASSRGVRVTAKSQPELFALVHDVALRAGFRKPDRIWLTHTTSVEAYARLWWRELLVGRVLVPCVSEFELRALVGHELALLQHRRAGLVIRLNEAWSAMTISAHGRSPAHRSRRKAAHEIALRPLGQAVHAIADPVAVAAGGRRDLLGRALLLLTIAHVEYDRFASEVTGPPRRWWQKHRLIEDLDDGWSRWVTHSTPWSLVGLEAAELINLSIDRLHPGLTGVAESLPDQRLTLAPSAPPQRLRPLTRTQRRRLARRARDLAGNDGVRWYTFATAPALWWSDRAKSEADQVRQSAVTVLDREPVDDFEAAEVLVTRNNEFLNAMATRAGLEREPSDAVADDPRDYSPPPILCGLVEDVLLPRGWRLEHPAIRGVLIGPSGERIDVMRSVTMVGEGYDLEPLRAVLRPSRQAA
jgi:hypothetical protein